MTQPAPRILLLPDFALIIQNHRDLADELSKCANIPAFDAGRAILNAIQNLTDEVRGVKNAPKASDINNISRLANSQLNNLNDDLHPLCSIVSGLSILNFPQTSVALVELDAQAVNTILRELGAEITGKVEARRQSLRSNVGLRQIPA